MATIPSDTRKLGCAEGAVGVLPPIRFGEWSMCSPHRDQTQIEQWLEVDVCFGRIPKLLASPGLLLRNTSLQLLPEQIVTGKSAGVS